MLGQFMRDGLSYFTGADVGARNNMNDHETVDIIAEKFLI